MPVFSPFAVSPFFTGGTVLWHPLKLLATFFSLLFPVFQTSPLLFTLLLLLFFLPFLPTSFCLPSHFFFLSLNSFLPACPTHILHDPSSPTPAPFFPSQHRPKKARKLKHYKVGWLHRSLESTYLMENRTVSPHH